MNMMKLNLTYREAQIFLEMLGWVSDYKLIDADALETISKKFETELTKMIQAEWKKGKRCVTLR